MSSYRFTTQANLDIESFCLYLGKRDPVAADRLLNRFAEICELLAEHPELGRSRPQFGEELRSFPVGNYLIFYQPDNDGVIIVRIIYGNRDLPPLF